jgi:D-alanyl-D-alanine dipeptidase
MMGPATRRIAAWWWIGSAVALAVACRGPDAPAVRPEAEVPAAAAAADTAIAGPASAVAGPAPVARPVAPDSGGPKSLLGDYAAAGDTLIIRENQGRIEAWMAGLAYPLEPRGERRFRLGGSGPAAGSVVSFEHDEGAQGGGTRLASAVVLDDVRLPRLDFSTGAGNTFRIDLIRPVAQLRLDAAAASPPEEQGVFRDPDLVDLATLDPTIRFDIRYSTTNNFMGAAFYDEPRAFLQRPAAEALLRVHRRLAAEGLGLLVFDAYRPWYVTWMFWHATPADQKMFVASPSIGSRHNRGAAVDLTLYDIETGEPLPMPSGYDEFSPRAYPDYPGGTSEERHNRERLRRAMEAEGFRVYHAEWWHFDHRDWRSYPILNLTFDRLDG